VTTNFLFLFLFPFLFAHSIIKCLQTFSFCSLLTNRRKRERMEAPKMIEHQIGDIHDALRFGLDTKRGDIIGSHPLESALLSVMISSRFLFFMPWNWNKISFIPFCLSSFISMIMGSKGFVWNRLLKLKLVSLLNKVIILGFFRWREIKSIWRE